MESGAIILLSDIFELVYFKDVCNIFNQNTMRPHIYKISLALEQKDLKEIDEFISSAIINKKQYYTFSSIEDVNNFIKTNNIEYSWMYNIKNEKWSMCVRAIQNKKVTHSQWITLDNMI